jgi:two-component system, OmpR family, phosphate regulon sensor histidine kinase PhoR
MSESTDLTRTDPIRAQDLRARLHAARWVIAATLAVLLLFYFADRLSASAAFIAALFVVAASLVPRTQRLPKAQVAQVAPVTSSRIPFAVDPQLAAVIGALPEPALLIDRRGSILVGNDATVSTIGPVRRGEPLSFTVRAPEVIEAVRAAADGRPQRVEFTERAPVERAFETYVTPIAFASGEGAGRVDGFLLTFHDLTAQRRVDKMRADFVANASHELRTPLASLSGFIETLQGPAKNDAPARERFLGIMVEQTRRMSRLIDDLLSLSRVELNEHLRPQTVVDLVPIVGHVCDTLSPLAKERGVELAVTRDAEQLPIFGERDELIRLFENLVENALKYGASGKRVEVTLAREGSGANPEAVVTVRDFGPGIASEHLPRLTERFYRVDAETSRAEGGTGLGLAIVKHILSRHRGRLAVDSDLGKGATFVARIPLSTASAA